MEERYEEEWEESEEIEESEEDEQRNRSGASLQVFDEEQHVAGTQATSLSALLPSREAEEMVAKWRASDPLLNSMPCSQQIEDSVLAWRFKNRLRKSLRKKREFRELEADAAGEAPPRGAPVLKWKCSVHECAVGDANSAAFRTAALLLKQHADCFLNGNELSELMHSSCQELDHAGSFCEMAERIVRPCKHSRSLHRKCATIGCRSVVHCDDFYSYCAECRERGLEAVRKSTRAAAGAREELKEWIASFARVDE